MKKKLLNLVFVVVSIVNALVFYSFTNASNDACSGGATVNAQIRIVLPSAMGSTYETCGSVNNFSINNLTYVDVIPPIGSNPYDNQQWYMTVGVSYDGSQTLYQNKYGQLPNAQGSGVRKYGFSGCSEQGYVASGNCIYFPVQFKEGYSNTIKVSVFSPCGHISSNRSLAYFLREFNTTTAYNQNIFEIGPQHLQYSVNHNIVCNPC